MDPAKRKLLNRMGIDVWQLRQAQYNQPVSQFQSHLEDPITPSTKPAPIVAFDGSSSGKKTVAKTRNADSNTVKKTEATSSTDTEWQFEVLYLTSGAASLVIDREDYRGNHRRLTDDILRMFGEPTAKPHAVSFCWPQLKAGSREAALGAWRAFIEKKLDSSVQLFVVDSELSRQLVEEIPLPFHWIPKLDNLHTQPQAKRKLWQALQSQTK